MSGEWFAPKRFGFGAGLPMAWQGWALLGAFIVALAVAAFALLPAHRSIFFAIVIVLTLAFSHICAKHAPGGWHWRWGGED